MTTITRTPVAKLTNDKKSNFIKIDLNGKHPRRQETGLKSITFCNGEFVCTFKPMQKTTNYNRITVYGSKDNIRRMFNEINTLLKTCDGNKASAVLDFLSGNHPVSINSPDILKSLIRRIHK